MESIDGISVSPGVAIGRAFVLDEISHHIPRRPVTVQDIPHQLHRLDQAFQAALKELEALKSRILAELDEDAADIVDFHIRLLNDTHFRDPIENIIKNDKVAAEYAVTLQIQSFVDRFLVMDHEAFRSKVSDLWDLDRRLLRHLVGETHDRLQHLNDERIVIAHELTPSQTVNMNPKFVRGFVTEAGGPTSHTAIMARSIGIPAVVGVNNLMERIVDDDLLIVDAITGRLILNPDDETVARYQKEVTRRREYRDSLIQLAQLPTVTRDGTTIQLYGNIEFASELKIVNEMNGDGVGLFRTEFLYLTSEHEPTEEEQFEEYRKAVQAANGKPVTIRTLDLGSDKMTQSRAAIPERNPALGCRSIRYSLQHLSMFKRQLRAILRAGIFGPTKIMFPLITGPTELRQARMVLRDVMEDLTEEGIKYNPEIEVGIMVEAPSAAIMAHVFAREADFLSIGTNDLVQYTLAVDRTNEKVANLYSACQPAIIRLLKGIIRAGKRQGIEVSLCGEVASDTDHVLLLLGLGLRSLSLVPTAIPDIKKVIRMVDIDHCEQVARKAGSFDSERQILRFLRDETRKVISEGFDGRSVEQG